MSKLRVVLSLVASAGLAACRGSEPRRIDVIATDYAFQAPAEASPGPTLVRLINRAPRSHELQFYRFRHHVTAIEGLRLLVDSTAPDTLFDVSGSVLIAAPGDTAPAALMVDLKRGEVWALVCGFRDSLNAPRHFRLGMLGVLEVK